MAEIKENNNDYNQLKKEPDKGFSDEELWLVDFFKIFCRYCITWLIIYLWGYFSLKFSWLMFPIFLFAYNETVHLDISKCFRIKKHENLTAERTFGRQASIVLTENENVEWANVIIKHLWPYSDLCIQRLFKTTLEPAIEKVLRGFNIKDFAFKINESQFKINGFKFKNISLGNISPVISNVQVNEDFSRKEIILDMDVEYDGNCHLEVSLSALTAGIRDIKLIGRIRIVLKPLIHKFPLIGGIQVYFLRNPKFYFNVSGAASIPGLGNILFDIINNQIKNRLVLPNSIAFKFSNDIDVISLKYPIPVGIIRIIVRCAKKLKKSDFIGRSDPFCCIHLGSQMFKTKTSIKTLNPKWNYTCDFIAMVSKGQAIEFEIWDFDVKKDHDFLGRASIDIEEILKEGLFEKQIPLINGHGKELEGEIHIDALWLSLTTKNLSSLKKDDKMKNSAMLRVWLHSAKCFASTKSLPNPFVRLRLGNVTKDSEVLVGTKFPIFEEGFDFMIKNPEHDPPLCLEIWDELTNKIQGKFIFKICSLLEMVNMEILDEQFTYNGTDTGPVTLRLNIALKFFKPPSKLLSSNSVNVNNNLALRTHAESNSESPILELAMPLATLFSLANVKDKIRSLGVRKPTDCGKIQVTLQYKTSSMLITINNVQNLPLDDDGDKPDSYVKMYLLPDRTRNTKKKSDVVKDSCNPVYNKKQFNYQIPKTELDARKLEISVINKKGFGHLHKSSVIGYIHIKCSSITENETRKSHQLEPEKYSILEHFV